MTEHEVWVFFRLCLALILLTVCCRSVTYLQVDSCNILASEIWPTLCRISPQLFPNYLSVFLLHHSTTRKPPARKSRALSFKSPWSVKERLTKEHICKKTFLHHWCTCHFHIIFVTISIGRREYIFHMGNKRHFM